MRNGAMARAIAIGLIVLSLAVESSAQSKSGPPWEIDIHGGGLFSSFSDDGTARLPDPGAVFTAITGAPSRRTSSWYFGDGAVMMNQSGIVFAGGSRLTPLDPALSRSHLGRDGGATVGVRLSRRVTNRLRAEIAIDYGVAQLALQREALAAITASQTSFAATFRAILSGPFAGSPVSSNARIEERRGRDVVTTGALSILLATEGRAVPFVIVGGGVVSNTGGSPEFSLDGEYTFQLLGVPTLRQSDRVSVRYTVADHAPVGVIGGGIRYAVSERWMLRVEARGSFSGNAVKVVLDATPQSAGLGGSFFGVSSGSPAIQFSSAPQIPSTLSGPAIDDFVTFSGSGLNRQFTLTAGLGWRF